MQWILKAYIFFQIDRHTQKNYDLILVEENGAGLGRLWGSGTEYWRPELMGSWSEQSLETKLERGVSQGRWRCTKRAVGGRKGETSGGWKTRKWCRGSGHAWGVYGARLLLSFPCDQEDMGSLSSLFCSFFPIFVIQTSGKKHHDEESVNCLPHKINKQIN